MAFTVLIPTHGRPTLLGRTLRSVAACERPEGYAECIVVENGPRSGAESVVAEVAGEHPEARLRYLHVERANKSNALNVALADISNDTLVVFFDDDVQVEPNVLVAYAEASAGWSDGGTFFGGPLECDYEQPPEPWLLSLLPFSAKGFSLEDARRVGYFLGANWAAFMSDMNRAGGFDPNYGPGSPTGARGQEKDMQQRLQACGCEPVELPRAAVRHYVPRERCSPAWAMQRNYEMGVYQGQQARVNSRPDLMVSVLCQLPRKVLLLSKHCILGNMQVGKSALVGIRKNIGFITGYVWYASRAKSHGGDELNGGGREE